MVVPPLLGLLRDVTGGFAAPWGLLIVMNGLALRSRRDPRARRRSGLAFDPDDKTLPAWVTTKDARGRDDDEPDRRMRHSSSGLPVDVVDWDDPDVAWSGYDRVVLRSTWDYPQRLDEFLAWLDAVDARHRRRQPGRDGPLEPRQALPRRPGRRPASRSSPTTFVRA